MSKKRNILFLNPPGEKIYIRDYYCSKVSKAYYLPQPVDLLIQTAFFDLETYDLKVIDAIAEKQTTDQVIRKVKQFSPDLIIGLLGSVSLNEDLAFYAKVHEQFPTTKIVCSGDALLDNHKEKLSSYKWLDAIITNFYVDGVRLWLDGEPAPGIVFLQDGKLIESSIKRGVTQMPIPKQHLFTGNYRMPFANASPVATVLSNYACPYPCTFCIMSSLPYSTRSAASIIEELKYLKEKGYRFIYFSDQTFFQSKGITTEVLKWMIETDYGINWMCFSRVDVVDEEALQLMKKAGCRLIMFGVEWADNELLEHYKKHYTVAQIKETFKLAKKLKIRRLGTFLIGVPGQSKESILNTFEFAKTIDADYASFNVAVPRSNTSFRQEALDSGLIDETVQVMDQSGDQVVMGNGVLSKEELQELKSKAYRSFYFRPSYILKRLAGISSFTELKFHTIEAWYILKGIIKKTND